MLLFLMPLTLVAYFRYFGSYRIAAANAADKRTMLFFRAGRQSPLVDGGIWHDWGEHFGGVTFVSVPGWAEQSGMRYFANVPAGFIVGYVIVALVLLPLYYKLGLTSIYAYLGQRFGGNTRRTGSLFFLLSKLTGGAARLFLVCSVITTFVVQPLVGNGFVQFTATACIVLLLIWGYTRQSGILTIVRTDALQTLCPAAGGGGHHGGGGTKMGLDAGGVIHTVTSSPMCKMFEWDWTDKQAFWRQFLSGIFIVIVMTGLDRDMMQKTRLAAICARRRRICVYGLAFLPVNALFLGLGILLSTLCANEQLAMPSGDGLLPAMVSSGVLGAWVVVPFTIGIVAAAFSSADSALTALTTTACIDLLRIEERNPDGRTGTTHTSTGTRGNGDAVFALHDSVPLGQ